MRGHSAQGRSCVGVNDLTIVYNRYMVQRGEEEGGRGGGGYFCTVSHRLV